MAGGAEILELDDSKLTVPIGFDGEHSLNVADVVGKMVVVKGQQTLFPELFRVEHVVITYDIHRGEVSNVTLRSSNRQELTILTTVNIVTCTGYEGLKFENLEFRD